MNYELEYRISNLNFIKSFIPRLSSEFQHLNDDIIVYQPLIPLSGVVFRKIQNHYERKEIIYKKEETVNDINIIIRYSLENIIKPINLPIQLKYKRIRNTYIRKNFKIDLTCRYYPIIDGLDFNFDVDPLNPIKRNGFKLVYDIEFEVIDLGLKTESSLDYLKCVMFNHDYLAENKIKKLLPFNIDKLPQVGILTPDMTTTNDFVWSDKMDGERCLVITYNNAIYMYQKIKGLKKVKLINDDKFSVYDCEVIRKEHSLVFYMFDCYIYNSEDMRNKPYLERLNVETPINKLNTKPVENWNALIRYAFKMKSNKDGIVLHSLKPFSKQWTFLPVSFKLKPVKLNTIDFLYEWNGDKYELYLTNTTLKPMKEKARHANKEGYMLFDIPYYNNTWFVKSDDPEKYNHKVVESMFDGENFTPIKIREDKQYPNSINVGLSNISLIYCPFSTEEVPEFNDASLQIFNKINHYFPEVVAIDYEGNNLEELYLINTKSIFVINTYKQHLIKYVNNFMNVLVNGVDNPTINILEQQIHNQINLNVIENNENVIQELIKKNEFNIGEINLIIMNKMNLEFIQKIKEFVNVDCLVVDVQEYRIKPINSI